MDYGIVPMVRKIAVLRANALGDFFFTLPALEAVRAAYPDAEITLLGTAWHRKFLENRPGPIDRMIVVPPSTGVRVDTQQDPDPEELDRFFSDMAAEEFDIALQLHGGGRYSNPFIQRCDATLSAGLRAPDAPPLDRWVPYCYFQPEILRMLEAVSLVGASPVVVESRIAVRAEDRWESDRLVPFDEPPIVVLHPGAGDARRRWPASFFAQVGDRLANQGYRVVIIGTPSERALVDQLANGMSAPAIDVCGQLSINGLAGFLARCELVISNDSGPLHLAAAVGTPAVGIYWHVNAFVCGELFRRIYRQVISWRSECPTCGALNINYRCEHDDSFVADIQVDEVLSAALDLLAHSRVDTSP